MCIRDRCKKGAVAFLMPPFAKSDLFKGAFNLQAAGGGALGYGISQTIRCV